ncbi:MULTISPECIES: hypothetical protein [Nonlabens]|uniref:hypothetical protein n=1 Tax=Nonlabens TaxID=363408 RepID=UPI000D458507|nr:MULTISPECIES: hypothetical protein [Nonlabens]PQJ20102.1 hypothetical protein BST93_01275 [Nonlabens tegetincola]
MSKKFSSKSLLCSITGHKYRVSKEITEHVKEYTCCKCNKKMTSTIYGQLLPLNDQYSRLNRALSSLQQAKVLKESYS